MERSEYKNLLKSLGPGILFASTCIGVSHLVQSTRAGADFSFALLWAVIIANILKYPFFEFAARYTSATGVSILDGYDRKGKWILWLYILITIPSMFSVSAAVTFVTAGLLENLFNIGYTTEVWTVIILVVCLVILMIGKYKVLDGLLKVIGLVLVLTTLVAFFSALFNGPVGGEVTFQKPEIWSSGGIIFLIALMGWMPTAVDISAWTSLWAEERIKQTGYRPKLKESLFDFNLGYWTSAVLAICFLSLGALVIYNTNTKLSNNSADFAGQIVGMYTNSIGKWSFWIISVAAFSTMFSTTITVLDGYGRAMARSLQLVLKQGTERRTNYILLIFIISGGTFLIVYQFLNDLRSLVDFATILSFVIAPLAAILNYIVIFSDEVKDEYKPKKGIKILAISGIIFLFVFTILFFIVWW
ncbi:MAG: Nramp family divalent metal transporter [Candidatus Cyclobacteriaceae bacterium M2_1C_046]